MRIMGNRIFIGEKDLYEIAKDLDTPFYIYDLEDIERRFMFLKMLSERYIEGLGKKLIILYALKANSNPHIISLLKDLGSGFDASSPGEVLQARICGVDPNRIYLTAPGLSKKDLEIAYKEKININIDSETQLRYLIDIGFEGEIGIRINPGFGEGFHEYTTTGGKYSKFGLPIEKLRDVVELAKKSNIIIKRLHAHIGSGIMDPNTHIRVLEKLLEVSRNIESVEEIDLGGGFGISYEDDREYPFQEFFEKLSRIIRDEDKITKILIEPGRFLVARAGVLVARVTDLKDYGDKKIVILDTGFNHLIRPALYGAKHRVVVLNRSSEEKYLVDIYGNLCESTDYIARDIYLPKILVGDIVAILDAGAYGYSMASMYNMRSLPREYVVYRGKVEISREAKLHLSCTRNPA
jgi:diaminopimelate decarboxylase